METLGAEREPESGFTDLARDDLTDIAKCPNCGANMIFSPADKALLCPYCAGKTALDYSKYGEELDFASLLARKDDWAKETMVYACENCGSHQVVSKNEIAKACSFCGTENIVKTKELSGLKPNAVLPFSFDKDAAAERVLVWAKKRLMAPREFKKITRPEELTGAYIPAFTFDTDTVTSYRGRLGKRYTTTRYVNGKHQTHTEIRYFSISGSIEHFFDDVFVQASQAIEEKRMRALLPFDTNNSMQYSEEFLFGFSAQQYTKDGVACWREARVKINEAVKRMVLAQYTYDVVDSLNLNLICNNLKYKYILLPVYVGHHRFRKKDYRFYINGRNGKITGRSPVSKLKVGAIVAAVAGVLTALGLLAYFFVTS